MIQKYVYGTPFETDAVLGQWVPGSGEPAFGTVDLSEGFRFTYSMAEEDIVYGLGEANRGINKRGYRYVSNCTDEPNHTEEKLSLYAAHNFIVVAGEKPFGLFFDYPASLTFDIGYTRSDLLTVFCQGKDLNLYVIDGDTPYSIVRQFRKAIGRSYIPPKFAFGYGQSRWGYRTMKDFRGVVQGYRANHIPLDMVYMDIDYMQDYKDFTVNGENFPDFPAFVREMGEQNIHLVPIIDAGVKVEEGYPVYEEGVKNNFFCKRADGSDFVAVVWPGRTHFPDFLNPEARAWFGEKYRFLLDQGIEGFWNDMNEPAIFFTPESKAEQQQDPMPEIGAFSIPDVPVEEPENMDYQRFYHNVGGSMIRHDRVHNLYGYNMTRAAGEGFDRLTPDRRILMFSRASYIGAHRYGGVWTGDNCSWWSHLLLNLKMLPSLNMCGFLYVGADLGGFGQNTTRDLLLRWLALGVFTPLMRNHSILGSRRQECYQFEHPEDFRHVIGVRYRLLPYLYSEYMKAALRDEMMFRPLAFDFPDDPMAAQVEDQLMLGGEVMITPVYTQNAAGRYVYLPEKMLFVKFLPDGTVSEEVLSAGHHYVAVALNEVPMFIRKGKCIPLAQFAESVAEVDSEHLTLLGCEGAEYVLYDDDGVHKDYENPAHFRTLRKE
ncbi:MAG: glycoside hydrolase family 31 protein [Oscillospiraceae bacterium]|nr:glycoside hydrolase family 31 protein [Oscillospiraceae bacterium]